MLYDPKWQKPSLASFIGWLETKSPKATYDFHNCQGECLIGQYMTSLGIDWGETPTDIFQGNWENTAYLKIGRQLFGTGALGEVVGDRPWTYGGALKRAREFAAR